MPIEEGPMSGWLYRNLHQKVNRFVVADPRRNKLISSDGDQDDKVDSAKLAMLLAGGYLREVYPIIRTWKKLAGIGTIRSVTVFAYLDTPWWFKKKNKLWKYCRVGLQRTASGTDKKGKPKPAMTSICQVSRSKPTARRWSGVMSYGGGLPRPPPANPDSGVRYSSLPMASAKS